MATVCFYFQVHQPERLRRVSVFDQSGVFFDEPQNREILRKVARKCYLPANELLLRLIERYRGKFRVSFSLSGVVLDQFARFEPEVLASFKKLAKSGAVEFLQETYYHSLSCLYSPPEWRAQIELHRAALQRHFQVTPTVLRNTELIYNNSLAQAAADIGYQTVLCEGPVPPIPSQPSTRTYRAPDVPNVTLLLKHARLSDDVAFRFSNRGWAAWPLMADTYARWLTDAAQTDGVVNLFMDYETFGEHQWAETGIFDFLEWLPAEFLKGRQNRFLTPSEVARELPPTDEYDVPHMTSWADAERDLSAWLGNAMQANALYELFALEDEIKASGDPDLLRDWRLLQISDHFYYMSTKYHTDGIVHRYFNPYDSPYDAFINFMNVLDQLRVRLKSSAAAA